MSTTTMHAEAIEAAIDSLGLPATIELIATICDGKADHIRTNWQDELLAMRWERAGNRIAGFSTRAELDV